MKDLQKLMDDIREWSAATFGEGQRTIPILHHLIKEVPEAIEAVKEVENITLKGRFEFADCMMLLLDAANHYGMTADDLIRFTNFKLDVNRQRKWGKPDENGVIEHLQEPEMKEYTCKICKRKFQGSEPFEICPTCYI